MTAGELLFALRDIERRDGAVLARIRLLAKRRAGAGPDIEALSRSADVRQPNVGSSQYEQPLPIGLVQRFPVQVASAHLGVQPQPRPFAAIGPRQLAKSLRFIEHGTGVAS